MAREGRGIVLRSPRGETFRFDPGSLCLEFALTGGEGDRAVYEALHRPADLATWISGALGVEAERVTATALRDAKRLREAIWQLADARIEARSEPAAAVEQVNRWAAKPPLAPRLVAGGRRRWALPATASEVLAHLARDAVELFTGPLADRIRQCAGRDCTLLFADTSRSGRRRWCSMERCGNRAKVRAFRER